VAILQSLREALRLPGSTVEPGVDSLALPAEPELAVVSIELEFAAYAEDCRIFGFLRVGTDRLSDALNDLDEYPLVDALVIGLADGRTAEARSLIVRRDELLAVRATGPRGMAARRSRRRPSPVTLLTGPYTVHGYMHTPPGADPLLAMRRRPPMVPLTEAWIEYASRGRLHRARVGTIIINRETIDWVRPAKAEEVHLPDLPAETAIDPRAKDLTGYIFTPGRQAL
jgi:hypothetical protein